MKKHILCIGDSNTHGYCADPSDCADGGIRFNEEERWTCLLQAALGPDYLVTEEGLSGACTLFPYTTLFRSTPWASFTPFSRATR